MTTETKEQPFVENSNPQAKQIAIISYITIIGLIIAFVMNSEKKFDFASYYIRQSLGLALTGLCMMVVNIIPFLGWIIGFFGVFLLLALWIIGLVNAINEKKKPLPVLGVYYEQWFKTIS